MGCGTSCQGKPGRVGHLHLHYLQRVTKVPSCTFPWMSLSAHGTSKPWLILRWISSPFRNIGRFMTKQPFKQASGFRSFSILSFARKRGKQHRFIVEPPPDSSHAWPTEFVARRWSRSAIFFPFLEKNLRGLALLPWFCFFWWCLFFLGVTKKFFWGIWLCFFAGGFSSKSNPSFRCFLVFFPFVLFEVFFSVGLVWLRFLIQVFAHTFDLIEGLGNFLPRWPDRT